MQELQSIIEYQEIDAKLRKIESELRASVNRKNAGDMQQYLKDGQARLLKLEEDATVLMEKYKQASLIYNDYINKIEKLAQEIEKNDQTENEAIMVAFTKLVATSENLDNHINALQGRVVAINKEVEGVMNNAKKARHNLDIYKMNYNKEKEKVAPEVLKLRSMLENAKKKVKPELLAKYNAKSESKIFPVIVEALNNKCGRCRMEISAGKMSELKNNGFIECENCGRVIYIKK